MTPRSRWATMIVVASALAVVLLPMERPLWGAVAAAGVVGIPVLAAGPDVRRRILPVAAFFAVIAIVAGVAAWVG